MQNSNQVITNGFIERPANEIFYTWLNDYKKSVQLSTFNNTFNIFEKLVFPFFSHLQISQLTVSDCEIALLFWYYECKNYNQIKSYVNKAFELALESGYLKFNPLYKASILSVSFNKDDYMKLLDGNANISPEKKIILALLATSTNNLQLYEVVALTWNDVNFKQKTIYINKVLTPNDQLALCEPKTLLIDESIMLSLNHLKNATNNKNNFIFSNQVNCLFMLHTSSFFNRLYNQVNKIN